VQSVLEWQQQATRAKRARVAAAGNALESSSDLLHLLFFLHCCFRGDVLRTAHVDVCHLPVDEICDARSCENIVRAAALQPPYLEYRTD
jgi:hypothetical protein